MLNHNIFRPILISKISDTAEDAVVKINYICQGKAVLGSSHNGKPYCPHRRTCLNCDSDHHPVRNCPNPVNFSRAAANCVRILRNENKEDIVHILLAHLCRELDESEASCVSNDIEANVEIFEKMLFSNIINSGPVVLEVENEIDVKKSRKYTAFILPLIQGRNYSGGLHRFRA